MAPLPPETTSRYWVDYQFQGNEHTFMLRGGVSATEAALRGSAEGLMNSLVSLMDPSWSVLGARYAPAGQTFTLPSTTPVITGTKGGSALAPPNFPQFASWIGRGTTLGRRFRVFIFGLDLTVPDTFRYTAPLPTALAAARTMLQNLAVQQIIVANGPDPMNVYNYVNVGFNSYWEREQRG